MSVTTAYCWVAPGETRLYRAQFTAGNVAGGYVTTLTLKNGDRAIRMFVEAE